MIRKLRFLSVAALAVAVAILAGCGKGGGAAGPHSFDSAAPELRASWDQALAADKANQYVQAVMGYKQIMTQRDHLTEAQVQALTDASGALNQRLVALASKGDQAAREAIATLGAYDRARSLHQQ